MNKKTPFFNQIEHDSSLQNAPTLKRSVTLGVIKQVIFVFLYACLISIVNYVEPSVSLAIGQFEYAEF